MQDILLRIKWHLNQLANACLQKIGLFGGIVVLLSCAILALLAKHEQDARYYQGLLNKAKLDSPAVTVPQITKMNGHDKIAAFQTVLLPYEDIPNAIQDLLQLSSQHDLMNSKGKYKAQIDQNGQFLRYQMVIPVKGDIESITQYIKQVFYKQKTIALENIKFTRKSTNSSQLEAHIQWVLFVRLPNE